MTVGSISQTTGLVVLRRQTADAPTHPADRTPVLHDRRGPSEDTTRADAPAREPVFVSSGRRTGVLRWTTRIAGLALALWASLAGVALLGADEPADLRVPRTRALPIVPAAEATDPQGVEPIEIDSRAPNGRGTSDAGPAAPNPAGTGAQATDPVVSLPILVPTDAEARDADEAPEDD